jgi:hypothetical protein
MQVASTIEAKQKAGDEALGAKKFGDALAAYDEALKALPERHALVAELHASKASVYLLDKKCVSNTLACACFPFASLMRDASYELSGLYLAHIFTICAIQPRDSAATVPLERARVADVATALVMDNSLRVVTPLVTPLGLADIYLVRRGICIKYLCSVDWRRATSTCVYTLPVAATHLLCTGCILQLQACGALHT